jgi:archaellum component FlaF (FlaF/FlaG flagellin family)
MQRRNKFSRRGIATVVTSAIMLTAVAIMGSGLVSWANSNLFGHERNLESSYSTNVNKINEYLTVENVWFSTSGGNNFVNITMNNPSTIGLNVTQIQLNANGIITNKAFTNQPILPKNSLSVNFTYATYASKVPINIYITTARGSIFTTQALSP